MVEVVPIMKKLQHEGRNDKSLLNQAGIKQYVKNHDRKII